MRRQADEWSLLSVISDVVATRKGAGYGMNSHTSAFATSWLDRCLESGHPCGCSHAADGRLSNASALEANCHNKMLRSHHRPFDGWRTDPSHMTDGEVFYSKEPYETLTPRVGGIFAAVSVRSGLPLPSTEENRISRSDTPSLWTYGRRAKPRAERICPSSGR